MVVSCCQAVLRCLAVYAEKMPRKFWGEAADVREFVMNKVLKRGQREGDEGQTLPDLGRRSKKQAHSLSPECLKVSRIKCVIWTTRRN